MRYFWLGVLIGTMMLAACGDDDSEFSTRPSDGKESSSSNVPESAEGPSSSSAESSSSSVTLATPCKTDSTDTCEYGMLVDDRDGQTYKTVKIGDQWWMAENLNYETVGSCYDDKASNCSKYGRLYVWAAARTACPSGWHLPAKAECETLLTAVGGDYSAGKALKSTAGWGGSGNGSDAFGFSALPAGYRSEVGRYYNEGESVDFWSSTEDYSNTAYHIDMNNRCDHAYLNALPKLDGNSVRCVKD